MRVFGAASTGSTREVAWPMATVAAALVAATIWTHAVVDLEFLFVPALAFSILIPALVLLMLTTGVRTIAIHEDGTVEFRSRSGTTRVAAKDIRATEYLRGNEDSEPRCRFVWDGGSIVVPESLSGLDEVEGEIRRHNRWFVGRFQDEHFRH